jgi:hypothetical protein
VEARITALQAMAASKARRCTWDYVSNSVTMDWLRPSMAPENADRVLASAMPGEFIVYGRAKMGLAVQTGEGVLHTPVEYNPLHGFRLAMKVMQPWLPSVNTLVDFYFERREGVAFVLHRDDHEYHGAVRSVEIAARPEDDYLTIGEERGQQEAWVTEEDEFALPAGLEVGNGRSSLRTHNEVSQFQPLLLRDVFGNDE